jgi:hypothetical protein
MALQRERASRACGPLGLRFAQAARMLTRNAAVPYLNYLLRRRHASLSCALVVAVLASACVAPTTERAPRDGDVTSSSDALDFDADWTNLHRIGGGWDSLADTPRGDCVITSPLFDNNPGATGNTTEWSLIYTKDARELRKALSISASASLKAGFGSGSIKAKYAENIQTNHFSVFATARVNVVRSSRTMRQVLLTNANASLVENGKLEIFRRRCGDVFVVGEQSGGEFIGVFEFVADSLDKRQELEVKVKAKGGTWSAQGSFASTVNELIASSSIRASGIKIGGSDEGLPDSADALVKRAYGFEKEVDERPASVRAIVADYATLENYVAASPISINRQLQTLNDLDDLRLDIKNALDDIAYALKNPNQFEAFDEAKISDLSGRADELRQKLNVVRDSWVTCGEDLNACALPKLGDISVNLPTWRKGTIDPKGTPIFDATAACGILRYNRKAEAPCPSLGGAPIIETNGDVCGYTELTAAVQDARCSSHAQTCASPACPGSHGDETRFVKLSGDSRLFHCDPGWKGECAEFAQQVGCVKIMCTRPTETASCTDAAICGVAYDPCTVVTGRIPNTCQVGTTPSVFVACEDPSFGVAEYNSCWHYADGTRYTGPVPPPAP